MAQLRAGRGLAHKADIAPLVRRLGLSSSSAIRIGDDCAAIPDGDAFLLFAIEGFLNEFVSAEPWFAGYCGVMVNLSDIYAMGGRPIAVVDAIWSRDESHARPVLDGLAAAAAVYSVPIVGGHSNTRNAGEQLSVAVLGRATRLLTSFDARPGDVLVAAIDLRGRFREPYPYWDCSSGAAGAGLGPRLRDDLELLPQISELGLCSAGKDISMAGLLGTALMLAECSEVGMSIDITAVPRPDGVDVTRWLTSFPSYGFLLTTTPGDLAEVMARFAARGIACAAVGVCESGTSVRVTDGAVVETFWDLATSALIGCGAT